MSYKAEWLSEKWYKFQRIYCKDGYIDRWMGDCIDSPNNPKQSQMCLNSSVTYYRLNNGYWHHSHDFKRDFFFSLLDLSPEFTATEIFLEYFYLKLLTI